MTKIARLIPKLVVLNSISHYRLSHVVLDRGRRNLEGMESIIHELRARDDCEEPA
jgi:hypothetical protein